MIDINFIRNNIDEAAASYSKRGLSVNLNELISLDDSRKKIIQQIQDLESSRNTITKQVGIAKRNGTPCDDLQKESIEIGDAIDSSKKDLEKIKELLKNKIEVLPNILDGRVPEGKDEGSNLLIKEVGSPTEFTFTPKNHYELSDELLFESAAKIAGSRTVILKGDIARLHRAIAQFMIDTHVDNHEFVEYNVPVLVNQDAMYNTDKLPKFSDQSFRTTDDRWLIPTSEVPLVAEHSDEILDGSILPVRKVAHSLCFRSEAGSAGKDTRGLIRQHQFEKVEMVTLCHPDDSEEEFNHLQKSAENILDALELPYRKMLLCAGDVGFGASITYDYEVWMPGQNQYREISSCSNTKDFQSRRGNIRTKNGKKSIFVHTLNGSGLAVGRTLAAIMENYQTEDGYIVVPVCLRKYMNKEIF